MWCYLMPLRVAFRRLILSPHSTVHDFVSQYTAVEKPYLSCFAFRNSNDGNDNHRNYGGKKCHFGRKHYNFCDEFTHCLVVGSAAAAGIHLGCYLKEFCQCKDLSSNILVANPLGFYVRYIFANSGLDSSANFCVLPSKNLQTSSSFSTLEWLRKQFSSSAIGLKPLVKGLLCASSDSRPKGSTGVLTIEDIREYLKQQTAIPLKASLSCACFPTSSSEICSNVSSDSSSSRECSTQTDDVLPTKTTETLEFAGNKFEQLITNLEANLANLAGLQLLKQGLYQEAYDHFERGANLGLDKALYNQGMCFYKGYGAQRDITKAQELWSQAAAKGHGLASYQLGIISIKAKKSWKETICHFKQAAELRVPEAQEFLKSLEVKNIDNIAVDN